MPQSLGFKRPSFNILQNRLLSCAYRRSSVPFTNQYKFMASPYPEPYAKPSIFVPAQSCDVLEPPSFHKTKGVRKEWTCRPKEQVCFGLMHDFRNREFPQVLNGERFVLVVPCLRYIAGKFFVFGRRIIRPRRINDESFEFGHTSQY